MVERLRLDELSDREIDLYTQTINLVRLIEEKVAALQSLGVYSHYREIHNEYLELAHSSSDIALQVEALKRLIFLSWYSMSEPPCFTGLGDLDKSTVVRGYKLLDELISQSGLDHEFKWMLSYYSSWEWIILEHADSQSELARFVVAVDTSKAHKPPAKDLERSMKNRGQMAVYWTS